MSCEADPLHTARSIGRLSALSSVLAAEARHIVLRGFDRCWVDARLHSARIHLNVRAEVMALATCPAWTMIGRRSAVGGDAIDGKGNDLGERPGFGFSGRCDRGSHTHQWNRLGAMQLLAGIGKPAFDVATKALNCLLSVDHESGALVHLLLRGRHVVPPLQSMNPPAATLVAEVGQRDRKAAASASRLCFGESEVIFECARQFDERHPVTGALGQRRGDHTHTVQVVQEHLKEK